METKLKNEMLKLQTELTTLGTAVKHISAAEKAATEAVNAAKDLSLKMDSKIDDITKSYAEMEVKYKQQFETIETFLASYSLLTAKTETIINEVKSSSITKEFEDVTKTINLLKTDIKNTQLLVDAAYTKTKQQLTAMEKEIASKKSESNTPIYILLIISILLSVGVLTLQFIK